MKFACGIVLYNPSFDNKRNLKEIINSFDYILIYDNDRDISCLELKDIATEYIHNKKNDGLAIPYNHFLNYCYSNDIECLCLLDQDSKLTHEQINALKEKIESEWSNEYTIYAPRLKGSTGSDWVINSNSFLNVKQVVECNISYDEFYFLDRLDADFCMQNREKNKKIRIFEDVIVDHCIGSGKRKEHSPIRHFYMSRNRNYYNKKYYSMIRALLITILQDIRHIGNILFFEKNRIKKFNSFLKGKVDYYKYLNNKQ